MYAEKKYAIDNLFILSEKKKKNTQKSEVDGEKKDTCLSIGGPRQRSLTESWKLIKFLVPLDRIKGLSDFGLEVKTNARYHEKMKNSIFDLIYRFYW